MTAEFHITRADSWAFNSGQEITEDEWMSLVAQDPELVLDPAGGTHFARWQSEYALADASFDWYDGNIFTKNLDRATLWKALQIAGWVGGRVQGDDGETYTSPEDVPEDSY